MSRTIYIYALIDPRNNEVRYIGKTDNPQRRLSNHITHAHRNDFYISRWLRALKRDGCRPCMEVLEHATDTNWADREKWWIEMGRFFGWKLTNTSEGGKGSGGIKRPIETRMKISRANSGERHHQFGKPIPDDVKAKIADSHRGAKNHFFGRSHSDETKRTISKKKIGSVPVNRRPVVIAGHVYESIYAAAKVMGVSDVTILYRVNSTSGRFDDYSYVGETKPPGGMRSYVGAGNPAAKLTREKVLEIRLLRSEGLTLAKIAGIMNVRLSTVGNICSGKSWKDVQ